MADDTKPLKPAKEETPVVTEAPAEPGGVYTFRSLCGKARINARMANAVRVSLGLRRGDFDKPLDAAAFDAALAALGGAK